MTQNFMDNYVDVATRLKMAFERWPELRVQETAREVIEMPDKSCFIRCTVTIWRDLKDPLPVIASACEIYPGRTPYTKTSESEVGYTSAIGRALAYMGIGANKSLASRDEIQAAQSRQPTKLAPVVPIADVEVPFPDEAPRDEPSNKQLGMIRALARGLGFTTDDQIKEAVGAALGKPLTSLHQMTKRDASKVIDTFKQPTAEEPF